MGNNALPPIPNDPISETHTWREWFFKLGTYLNDKGASNSISISNIILSGSSPLVLTTAQSSANIIEFTGVLTNNVHVLFPAEYKEWYIYNGTTGPYTVTVRLSTSPGLGIQQGFRGIFYSNTVDMFRANDPAVG